MRRKAIDSPQMIARVVVCVSGMHCSYRKGDSIRRRAARSEWRGMHKVDMLRNDIQDLDILLAKFDNIDKMGRPLGDVRYMAIIPAPVVPHCKNIARNADVKKMLKNPCVFPST